MGAIRVHFYYYLIVNYQLSIVHRVSFLLIGSS